MNNKNNNNSEYISLQDATEFCKYSQEYLSLRARQGKLRAMKLGRNWVTTKEWLQDYVQVVEEYNNLVNNKKVLKEKIPLGEPPKNLPTESIFLVKQISFKKDLRPVLATTLVFVLLIGIGFFGKGEFIKSYTSTLPYVEQITQNLEQRMESVMLAAMDLQVRQNIIKEYGQWLGQQAQKMTQLPLTLFNYLTDVYSTADKYLDDKLVKAYQAIFPIEESEEEPAIVEEKEEKPEFGKEGVVVLPLEEEADEQIEKLKESFSDEVTIEPKDELSGIIRPIFREPSDQEYLYLMVPLKN